MIEESFSELLQESLTFISPNSKTRTSFDQEWLLHQSDAENQMTSVINKMKNSVVQLKDFRTTFSRALEDANNASDLRKLNYELHNTIMRLQQEVNSLLEEKKTYKEKIGVWRHYMVEKDKLLVSNLKREENQVKKLRTAVRDFKDQNSKQTKMMDQVIRSAMKTNGATENIYKQFRNIMLTDGELGAPSKSKKYAEEEVQRHYSDLNKLHEIVLTATVHLIDQDSGKSRLENMKLLDTDNPKRNDTPKYERGEYISNNEHPESVDSLDPQLQLKLQGKDMNKTINTMITTCLENEKEIEKGSLNLNASLSETYKAVQLRETRDLIIALLETINDRTNSFLATRSEKKRSQVGIFHSAIRSTHRLKGDLVSIKETLRLFHGDIEHLMTDSVDKFKDYCDQTMSYELDMATQDLWTEFEKKKEAAIIQAKKTERAQVQEEMRDKMQKELIDVVKHQQDLVDKDFDSRMRARMVELLANDGSELAKELHEGMHRKVEASLKERLDIELEIEVEKRIAKELEFRHKDLVDSHKQLEIEKKQFE
jgi:hypothetical protein